MNPFTVTTRSPSLNGSAGRAGAEGAFFMGGLMSGFRRILFTTLFFHVLCPTGCAAHDDGGSPDIRISGTMENSFTWRK